MTLVPGQYTGPSINADDVALAEKRLGVRLPADYVADILQCNGGGLPATFVATSFPTTWAPNGFEVTDVLGIGGEMGIDHPDAGALAVAREWGYPDGCIAFGITPAAGPDTVAFDYRACGPQGEPDIVYIDVDNQDPGPYRIAATYSEFLALLTQP